MMLFKNPRRAETIEETICRVFNHLDRCRDKKSELYKDLLAHYLFLLEVERELARSK